MASESNGRAAVGPEVRAELIRLARELGATDDELAAYAPNLGELSLDLSLRPRGTGTLTTLAAELDIEMPVLQRLVGALGLPTDPHQALTTGEETTIRLFTGVSRDLLGERSTLRAARVTGAAMARIAATLVEGFRLQIEMPRRDSGVPHPEVVEMYSELTSTVLPAFIESLDAVLRCQILTAGKQMWSTDVDRSAMTVERTVGFVDLVGYTALVETLSVGQLAELLSDFDETTSEVVSRWNGTIVKSIGDELMFVTQDPNDACRIAVELIERFGSDGHLPVRVGLATGEMVSVLGDLFGANVNLAARLVAVAEPGTTVVSELTGDSVSGYDLGALPPLTLKGIPHPVVAHVLR